MATIYTKTGDFGETGLPGGKKSPKSDEIFEVLGTLDEFNSLIGLLITSIQFSTEAKEFLISVQSDLFEVGALLAKDEKANSKYKFLEKKTLEIEKLIDELLLEVSLPNRFVLPGGTKASAMIDFVRTVCRRLERKVVKFTPIPEMIMYLNRMSDLLFVLARFVNFKENVEESTWSLKK